MVPPVRAATMTMAAGLSRAKATRLGEGSRQDAAEEKGRERTAREEGGERDCCIWSAFGPPDGTWRSHSGAARGMGQSTGRHQSRGRMTGAAGRRGVSSGGQLPDQVSPSTRPTAAASSPEIHLTGCQPACAWCTLHTAHCTLDCVAAAALDAATPARLPDAQARQLLCERRATLSRHDHHHHHHRPLALALAAAPPSSSIHGQPANCPPSPAEAMSATDTPSRLRLTPARAPSSRRLRRPQQ